MVIKDTSLILLSQLCVCIFKYEK